LFRLSESGSPLEGIMTTLAHRPAAGLDSDLASHGPSLTVAALGFVGSTLLTATVMVLLSAL
jgi:hypothetical protein